ncbi:3D-(3,5/4)-trihydroxycyclohexane-1,2-dione acylhydrolase (decyclizing) [Mesorhizobium escarrei]|uniref:3D-(3,5/4)-trihydroxycyclohexane-1,2-dione hydrolase 1 n=1 Tax=Mesorhizobium escarrei TaxID=666018 RepID=A0ABM9EFC8_9HYPH|nr:3D-(3,5/4)-trihydroxycyclohexane-1,2-dione acylhydrolase (decyclizing) [Mesorhizobium escarrei]CAH2408057.1 3D-(3,5/4)-trihydroxycyclohexane-1,2-dione hydrolase 1 [Mesorhizobium escarrei]
MTNARSLTAAQAVVLYLKSQFSVYDDVEERLIGGMFGIFGHGNVAGMGEALDEYGEGLPFYQAKNEQSMVHAAMGFAKAMNRRATLACTASIGPGSTNMLTGAATATINRVPVLLLPSDIFAHRRPGNVLQQLEHPIEADLSVNDSFRPLSRFFDRISRPEQLLTALPEAMRVLVDPAETGAVTISLPQDVQGEAFPFPARFFEKRRWQIRRMRPNDDEIASAAELIATARRPLIIAGGGVRYAAAQSELVAFCNRFGIPVMETFAGKGVSQNASLLLGGGGTTGTAAAARIGEKADVVIAIGTRLTDFATASRSHFNDDTRFVAINVNAQDAHKLGAAPVVADAKLALLALSDALGNYATADAYRAEVADAISGWWATYHGSITHEQGAPMKQGTIIASVNAAAAKGDVVIAAAGTSPGEIMKAWDNSAGSECFIEFGFSCMGHEIPAGLGVAIARYNQGNVFVVIGDGTYLMAPTELVTAAQEGARMITIVIENGGFQCIRALQAHSTGTDNFGNEFRRRTAASRQPDGDYVDVDYEANARSMGCVTFAASNPQELAEALDKAKTLDGPSVIIAQAEKRGGSPGADLWWEVGVAEVSELERVRAARRRYETGRARQKAMV